MEISILVSIIWAHFVADFVLQTDKMATSKSTSYVWLSNHILVYSGAMLGLMAPTVYFMDPDNSHWLLTLLLMWTVINGAFHWITDWCSSRVTSYLWKKGDRHNFFIAIGADQAVHMMTMIITWTWIFH